MGAVLYRYECGDCKARKYIQAGPTYKAPKDVPCGWRGCEGRAALQKR